jgi:hypothetical protein
MRKKIEGVIERCSNDLTGHAHGFYILLEGSTDIYWLPAQEAYATVYGRKSSANESLVALTHPGDHVSFESDGIRAVQHSFRNWTLEKRLLGAVEKDITPHDEQKRLVTGPSFVLAASRRDA